MYVWSVIFPPLAVLLCRRPWQAIINMLLLTIFYIPAVIHALLIVKEYKDEEKLNDKLMERKFKQL